ncbi:DUF4254 domain-containing protein [Nocardia sp. NEAU-G5]|uniref:DUF4254 domain-containing protein n=1 Tax=Nocardia albiluteola TaxID=2842303 RepID=A0ABS6AX17_9NOCA|nr:DUF4254 domain-containing protein [Nocardia albiluteola]MBU3062615.1 DUF4254 domain-containing protein [Nocardia albiluteola]MBU3065551.1 DUF4254 domain-containing protein [Nocardia albiluteola]
MATEYAGSRIGSDELPSVVELLRAFRAPVDGRGPAHGRHRPVLDAAHELVGCHERRYLALAAAHAPGAGSDQRAHYSQLVDDIDAERAKQVAGIDIWVADNIAHRSGASLHTETLGAVIDRMAAKWVAAQDALGLPCTAVKSGARTRAGIGGPHGVDAQAHLHWVQLAELADGYKDLITDVTEHRRRLPVF